MHILPLRLSTEQLSETEKNTLDDVVTQCLNRHRRNRHILTQLTLESVTALTAGQARAKELQRQGFFQRLWRQLTGKNLSVQAQISFELAQAQYASHRMIEQLVEQHALTFEVVSAVNNKLNTLTLEFDEELNQVYESLKRLFAEIRAELVGIHEHIAHLERNIGLLQWSHTIEYKRYQDCDYAELADIEKLICVANDFFQQTQGNWSTNDLMLLKSALAELGIAVKSMTSAQRFFQALLEAPHLIARLFEGLPAIDRTQLETYDAPLLQGIEKVVSLQSREAYLVQALLDVLHEQGRSLRPEDAQLALLQHYLRQYAGMRIEQEVNLFDFVLEMLLGLRMVFDLAVHETVATEQAPEKENTSESDALPADLSDLETPLDRRMIGNWHGDWYLPRLQHCRVVLEIVCKTEENRYQGKLNVQYGSQKPQQEIVTTMLKVTVQQKSSTTFLTEEAVIIAKDDQVVIECANPSQPNWNPDSFELELDRYADVMHGFSKHAQGFRGKITLTRQ